MFFGPCKGVKPQYHFDKLIVMRMHSERSQITMQRASRLIFGKAIIEEQIQVLDVRSLMRPKKLFYKNVFI